MMLLAANYHYVGMPAYPYPAIHGLAPDALRRHFEWIQAHFTPVGLRDLLAALEGRELPSDAFLITFDDGLACQYKIVAPLMEHLDCPVTFFVSTQPLEENRATRIHKSHFVRAHFSPEEIGVRAEEIARAHGVDASLASVPEEIVRAHYRYDSPTVARQKYFLNYLVPEPVASEVIDELFHRLCPDEAAFCRDWYMSPEQIRALHRRFGCIGSHSHSHSPLRTLEAEQAEWELRHSREMLEDMTGAPVLGLSYPLGNEHAVSKREADLASRCGYALAFTMERETNLGWTAPRLMARLDCNDLPDVGKAPLFRLTAEGLIHLDGRPSCRRRYVTETP